MKQEKTQIDENKKSIEINDWENEFILKYAKSKNYIIDKENYTTTILIPVSTWKSTVLVPTTQIHTKYYLKKKWFFLEDEINEINIMNQINNFSKENLNQIKKDLIDIENWKNIYRFETLWEGISLLIVFFILVIPIYFIWKSFWDFNNLGEAIIKIFHWMINKEDIILTILFDFMVLIFLWILITWIILSFPKIFNKNKKGYLKFKDKEQLKINFLNKYINFLNK